MNNKYLNTIKSEQDLIPYEKFLSKTHISKKENPKTFIEYLKMHKGKGVITESITGNFIKSLTGILYEVGDDYIIISQFRGNRRVIIPSKIINFITFIR